MIALINGDSRRIPLADRVAQTCITSPPYWGLRDYGTARWEGGDLPDCSHQHGRGGDEARGYCPMCGARRVDSQIGLEQTPDAYVAKLVEVFREVRRVLRDDGTLWLNLGDSYSRQAGDDFTKKTDSGIRTGRTGKSELLFKRGNNVPPEGLKPKDLVGIPWRVAFALQADGWYLRQDIIWHKPNPMPESVTDRCTKAHEYVFLLAKSQRYYWDAAAIAEPSSGLSGRRSGSGGPDVGRLRRDASRQIPRDTGTRNRRSVWTITPRAFRGAHFATFPPALVEPMVLAGSRPGDLVLDLFAGSGTVGAVCVEQGRRFVGVELNPAYIEIAKKRIGEAVPKLREVA